METKQRRFGASLINAEELEANYDYGAERKALDWISQVIGMGHISDIMELQTGEILCDMINKILPNSTRKVKAKHLLDYNNNLNQYLGACKKIGVSDSDLFTTQDFGVGKRDMKQVVQNIFAVGRRAQVLKCHHLPQLGVTMYRTVEQERALEEKKRKEREEEIRQKQIKDEEARVRSDQADKRKDERGLKFIKSRLDKLKERSSRAINSRLKRRNTPEKRTVEEILRDSEDRTLFGMDEEQHVKMIEKYENDYSQECALMDWMEEVTGEIVEDLWVDTKSGRLLCRLMNKLKPGLIPKIGLRRQPMMEKDNIALFVKACKSYGVEARDLFETHDLYEKRNMNQVMIALNALRQRSELLSSISTRVAPPSAGDRRSAKKRKSSGAQNKPNQIPPYEIPEIQLISGSSPRGKPKVTAQSTPAKGAKGNSNTPVKAKGTPKKEEKEIPRSNSSIKRGKMGQLQSISENSGEDKENEVDLEERKGEKKSSTLGTAASVLAKLTVTGGLALGAVAWQLLYNGDILVF
eukprot:TRINITY_DN11700_c0_g1_i1.p1 TRINITY_DN11700_c0_g1~~TRINITY_DN11700_c0_g1_i1.p1  ORF type:complete len:523 (+),score=102.57 TRINITY_DN11700_c0_g1_i1:54-1622(+)